MLTKNVTAYVLLLANEHKYDITSYDLHKILYLLQYTWLQRHDIPLMDDAEFHACRIGPKETLTSNQYDTYVSCPLVPLCISSNTVKTAQEIPSEMQTEIRGILEDVLLKKTNIRNHELFSHNSLWYKTHKTWFDTMRTDWPSKNAPITNNMMLADMGRVKPNTKKAVAFKIRRSVREMFEPWMVPQFIYINYDIEGIRPNTSIFTYTCEPGPNYKITAEIRSHDRDCPLTFDITLLYMGQPIDKRSLDYFPNSPVELSFDCTDITVNFRYV